MRTERGVYVRCDLPSSDQIVHLIAMALESSADILLSGPEEPDDAPVGRLCERVAPFAWRINARSSEASAISKWLYMGNWCLFLGVDGSKAPIPFEFRGVENILDEVFEAVGATGGMVAFHDNTTIWVYLKTASG